MERENYSGCLLESSSSTNERFRLPLDDPSAIVTARRAELLVIVLQRENMRVSDLGRERKRAELWQPVN